MLTAVPTVSRRDLLCASGGCALVAGMAVAATAWPESRLARLGRRVAAALGPDGARALLAAEEGRLRMATASADRAAHSARDHRSGATVTVDGLRLSRFEAAWILAETGA